MRRGLLLIIVAMEAILASCQASDDATGPRYRGGGVRPRSDVDPLNCNMDQSKCDIIRAGIDYLLNHANVSCRSVGQVALSRFEAPASYGEGYQEATQVPGIDMGVPMTLGNSYSGYVATSGYVNVYGSFWAGGYTDPAHTGALLAHEEQHENGMDGPGHNTTIANAYQESCLNPAA